MIKKLLGFLFALVFLSSCGIGDEDEVTYLDAISENWKAEMTVTLPAPPETNAEIDITYIYKGKESNTAQKVRYNHILEWGNNTISTEGDFLPTLENPSNIQLYDTRLLGGYEIGQKWITEVTWLEDGKERTERLVFEKKDGN